MIHIACALVVGYFQTGVLDIGPAHVRVMAIGDFTRPGLPAWDATGRRLTPTEAKAIKGMPKGQKFGYNAESLRRKTDLGRFVVLQIDSPRGFFVAEDFHDDTSLGGVSMSASGATLYLSLPKGTNSFEIPFTALSQGQGNMILEFTEGGAKRDGDMRLTVTSHEAARVTYTKPNDKVVEKKDPLVQYVVMLDVPAAWSDRVYDLEAPGVVWPKTKGPVDPMGPESRHGMVDEQPIGKDRMRITLTIATPGPKIKNQKLRLVEREMLHGVLKNLPSLPLP